MKFYFVILHHADVKGQEMLYLIVPIPFFQEITGTLGVEVWEVVIIEGGYREDKVCECLEDDSNSCDFTAKAVSRMFTQGTTYLVAAS